MMPDITMCEDHKCPKRKDCYRFTAKPSGNRQSWFYNSPRDTEEKEFKCDNFWEVVPMNKKELAMEKECHELAIKTAGKDASYNHYLFCKVLIYEALSRQENRKKGVANGKNSK